MKIASITITMNDFHAIEQWKRFHLEYGSGLYKHIIVDNNSSPEYKATLKQNFPDSILIERTSNGGTTGAYNSGIKEALKDPQVDSIMLIANDIKISANSIQVLHQLLFSGEKIGAVAPVLLEKDEKTIIAYGEMLKEDMGLERLYHRVTLNSSLPFEVESECLPGGMNMMRREVYEKVGLQDESLFMYMDENDYFYRVHEQGYKIAATKKAQASHCHIVTEGASNDNSLAWFYINRNHILVCKKYKPTIIYLKLVLRKIFWSGLKQSVSFIVEKSFKKVYYYYLGIFFGIVGYSKNIISKK